MSADCVRSARGILRCVVLAAAALVLAVSAGPAFADYPPTTAATLLDRVQIEDLLAAYYEDFNVATASYIANGAWPSNADFGAYYLEDGTLDVRGMHVVARGGKQIDDFYRGFVGNFKEGRSARVYMCFTNPRITVNGDTATAVLIWTFLVATDSKAAPQINSMGQEHDDLVKQHGRWYFKGRVISQ